MTRQVFFQCDECGNYIGQGNACAKSGPRHICESCLFADNPHLTKRYLCIYEDGENITITTSPEHEETLAEILARRRSKKK